MRASSTLHIWVPSSFSHSIPIDIHILVHHIQPYSLSASSQHLTVGGLISLSLTLSNIPRPTQILSVTAYVVSNYLLYSLEDFDSVDKWGLLENSPKPRGAIRRYPIFSLNFISLSREDNGSLVSEVRKSDGSVVLTAPLGRPPAGLTPIHYVEPNGSYRVRAVCLHTQGRGLRLIECLL